MGLCGYLIDEMQNLEPVALGALCMAFHKLAQQQLPVALVAAGLPPLPGRLRSAKPYAERLFEYFALGALPDAAARSALVTPATRKGVEFGESAVELVLAAAQFTVPHFAGFMRRRYPLPRLLRTAEDEG